MATTALRKALAAPQNQLDDINVADMGTPQPAQQSIPDGYVLVPAELTQEMRAAAKPFTTVSTLWAAIIAAAPLFEMSVKNKVIVVTGAQFLGNKYHEKIKSKFSDYQWRWSKEDFIDKYLLN